MSTCRGLVFELIAVNVKLLMLSAVFSISDLRYQNLVILFKQCLAFRDSNDFSWSKLKKSNLSRSKRACSLHTFSDRKLFSDLRHFIQLKSSASDFLIYSHPSLLTARLSSPPRPCQMQTCFVKRTLLWPRMCQFVGCPLHMSLCLSNLFNLQCIFSTMIFFLILNKFWKAVC